MPHPLGAKTVSYAVPHFLVSQWSLGTGEEPGLVLLLRKRPQTLTNLCVWGLIQLL